MPVRTITIAITFVLAGTTQAAPMRFVNPAAGENGHFDWENDGAANSGTTGFNVLDILLSPAEQGGFFGVPSDASPNETISLFAIRSGSSFDPFSNPPGFRNALFESNAGARIALNPLTYPVGQVVGPGGVIPAGGSAGIYGQDFDQGGVVSGGSELAVGEEHFLAVSFVEFGDFPDFIGVRYGYLGFELFADDFGFLHVSATRWGYETQLDTAITIIPAPSAAIPLLALAGGVLNRRRRNSHPSSVTSQHFKRAI